MGRPSLSVQHMSGALTRYTHSHRESAPPYDQTQVVALPRALNNIKVNSYPHAVQYRYSSILIGHAAFSTA